MNIFFGNLNFVIENEKVYLKTFGPFENASKETFVDISVSGRNKNLQTVIKMTNSSERGLLGYVSHNICENK